MGKVLLGLDEIQAKELDILKSFSAFCVQRGLRYSMLYGSLIGTVRHEGFIPWDDDIDVGMPRPDYQAFIDLAESFEEETGYYIEGLKGLPVDIAPILKICNRRVAAFEHGGMGEVSLWLDVFPIDGLPSDAECAHSHCQKIWRKRMLLVAQTSPVSSAKTASRKVAKAVAKMSCLFTNPEKLASQITNLAKRYDFEKSEFVNAVTWANTGFVGRFEKSAFYPESQLSFEGMEVPVISCYDSYLRNVYGNYMQIPPESKRETHSLRAWLRSEG